LRDRLPPDRREIEKLDPAKSQRSLVVYIFDPDPADGRSRRVDQDAATSGEAAGR